MDLIEYKSDSDHRNHSSSNVCDDRVIVVKIMLSCMLS